MLLGLILIGCAATPAPDREPSIDKSQPYLEFKLTYNYAVYKKPSFFLPKSQPTFAIWLQEKKSGRIQTIYVTGKAAENKWILAESRPESIPVWYGVRKNKQVTQGAQIDAISGANGQPSLVWKAELNLSKGVDTEIEPEIIGHGHLWGKDHKIHSDLSHITSARDTFSYIGIQFFDGN